MSGRTNTPDNSNLALIPSCPVSTANVRMDCVNPEAMSQYFDLLNDVLEEYGLKTEPERIYNVDETGMPLDHRPPKIVTQRGHKKVRASPLRSES